jgi:hypothetical protein
MRQFDEDGNFIELQPEPEVELESETETSEAPKIRYIFRKKED